MTVTLQQHQKLLTTKYVSWRMISNLRYAGDITLLAGSTSEQYFEWWMPA